jgi:hypothetical protein
MDTDPIAVTPGAVAVNYARGGNASCLTPPDRSQIDDFKIFHKGHLFDF